jgi:LPS sulfotransferase NodH
MIPCQSYVIACTPRSGSHLLADGLASTGVAGRPTERFPRLVVDRKLTSAEIDALVTEPPPEDSYDAVQDADYVRKIIELGTTPNGIFGITIHWFVVNDTVRRIREYLELTRVCTSHEVLTLAFPKLSYIWLRRRDKVAQAVSWYKAIQTGRYVNLVAEVAGEQGHARTPLQFDYQRIRAYRSALISFDNAWAHFFRENQIEPQIVYYEDLAANYESTIRKMIAFLGLDVAHLQIRPSQHKKAADQVSFEWIARFKSISANGS